MMPEMLKNPTEAKLQLATFIPGMKAQEQKPAWSDLSAMPSNGLSSNGQT